MISLFRDFTKSWVFTALMGLLILSFAVFGLRDVFSPVGGNNVIVAGRRTMSDDDFKQWFDKFREDYPKQHNGETLSAQDFVDRGWYMDALNQKADQLALVAWFETQHIQPSAKLLVDQVAKYPAFQNPATGVFDTKVYRDVLAQNSLTETQFERNTLDDIAAAQYSDAAFAGVRAPRIFTTVSAAFELQTRDLSYVVVSPQSVPAPGVPTDADIKAFYDEHKADLTVPETRRAELVSFSVDGFMRDIKVDEDALHKAFQLQLPTLQTPETRSFVEVTAPDANAANAISAAMKAGQTPDAAAKAHNGKVLPFAAQAKDHVPDQKVADAVFSLNSGDVSAPIQGDLGIAVVKVGDIKVGTTPTFESQRAKLVAQVTKDKALDKLNQVTHAFADAMAAGDDFDATAKKLGLEVRPLPSLTAQGLAVDPATGQPMLNAKTGQPADYSAYPGFKNVLKDIFALQPGAASDVESLGEGQYFAVKLVGVQPTGPVPLDNALKARLAQAWQANKVASAVEAKADDVVARLKKGESFESVAAEVKSPLQKAPGVTRQAATQKLGPAGGRIFAIKPGEPFQGRIAQVAFLVGRVDAVHQGTPETANQMAAVAATQLSNSFKQDIANMTPAAARQAVKTTTYPTTVLRALDVTPPEAPAAKPGSKKAQ